MNFQRKPFRRNYDDKKQFKPKNRDNAQRGRQPKHNDGKSIKCFNCNKIGHYSRDCRAPRKNSFRKHTAGTNRRQPRAARKGARKAEEETTSFAGPIDIFPVKTTEQSCRAAFNYGSHSPDCILRAAPYFGQCMSCLGISPTSESPPIIDLIEPTNLSKPIFKKRSQQEQQDFALSLIHI